MESTRFKTNWVGDKKCNVCSIYYIAKSGNSSYCNECRVKKSICPNCNGIKSIYNKFCSGSCSSKWNYNNNPKVRKVIKDGAFIARKNAGSRLRKILIGRPRLDMRGDKNPNWKGGNTKIKRRIRHIEMGRVEYRLWRTAVFERDNYTCKMCNVRGKKLNADHILPYSLFPEFCYDITNGRTLCVGCHKKTETWGHKIQKLKREDFLWAV